MFYFIQAAHLWAWCSCQAPAALTRWWNLVGSAPARRGWHLCMEGWWGLLFCFCCRICVAEPCGIALVEAWAALGGCRQQVPGRGACKAGTQDGSMYWGCPGRECAMWAPRRGAAWAPRRGACLPPALRGSAALGSTWVFPCQVRHQAGLVELRWELKSERIGDDGLRGGKAEHHLYRSSADRPCGSCLSVALLSWPAGSEQAWIRFISE